MESESIIIISLVFLVNILWLWLKVKLNEQGYTTHLFWGHLKDLKNANRVIEFAEDNKTKQIFRTFLISIIAIIISIPAIFFIIVSPISFQSHQCKRFNDYLTYQVTGVVEDKFIDTDNHAYKTLSLTNGTLENEVTIFVDGLYQFIQNGDSISKASGRIELNVYRNGELTSFRVDRKSYCSE